MTDSFKSNADLLECLSQFTNAEGGLTMQQIKILKKHGLDHHNHVTRNDINELATHVYTYGTHKYQRIRYNLYLDAKKIIGQTSSEYEQRHSKEIEKNNQQK